MNVSITQKPPVGGMAGSIHDWERGIDPFGSDAGWIALDFWGNQIGFCADGTEIPVKYDSSKDTLAHVQNVQGFLSDVLGNIAARSLIHDGSKLEEPEKSMYDEFTPKLRDSTYGSDEYKAILKEMGPALQHHYASNSHHPEHFKNGINGMSLLDLIEMLADWKAAGMRHAGGNMQDSLKINKERFGISDQLFEILQNTAKELGWL